MIIKIAYSRGNGDTIESQIREFIKSLKEDNKQFQIVSYDEEHHKEKKDAFMLKASCGARLLPFCAIYDDDKELIKAFYSEVGECTFINIVDYINSEVL